MRQAGPLPLLPLACLFRAGSAARSSEDLGALEADSAVGLASDGEEWRICNPFSSEVTRRYYFQSVEEDGDPTAIAFVRDKNNARLHFYKHTEWTAKYERYYVRVSTEPVKKYRSQWQPAVPLGSKRPYELATVYLSAQHLDYVRCVPVSTPDGAKSCLLEIKSQGVKNEFFGGMYFPDSLARQALRHFKDGKAAQSLMSPVPNCTTQHFDVNVRKGSEAETNCQLRVAATIEAAFRDSSFDSSDWKFNDGRNIGIYASMGGGFMLGMVAGGPIGALVGTAITGTTVGVGALYQYLMGQKDIALSASDKIFEKLRCMSMFSTCGNGALVPKGKPCPLF
mmetsp:Transcript_102063/g.266336  ORF Transcript_102063/g.266336 Transcript_102063/m.266336 type:complete len:338 (+) Transcript_102063:101-1114(+)